MARARAGGAERGRTGQRGGGGGNGGGAPRFHRGLRREQAKKAAVSTALRDAFSRLLVVRLENGKIACSEMRRAGAAV